MSMNDMEAFTAGRKLGKANFQAAMKGLLAGHQDLIDEMADQLAKKDLAFLMALSLTEKGKRLDKNGVMEKAIAAGLEGIANCETEKKFLNRVKA